MAQGKQNQSASLISLNTGKSIHPRDEKYLTKTAQRALPTMMVPRIKHPTTQTWILLAIDNANLPLLHPNLIIPTIVKGPTIGILE